MQAPNQTPSVRSNRPQPPNGSQAPPEGLEVTASDNASHQKHDAHMQVPQTMFSQESFQHYIEDSQREFEEERRRLREREQARKQFANSLTKANSKPAGAGRARFSHEHGGEGASNRVFNPLSNFQKMPRSKGENGVSQKDRLASLLEMTEAYTKFILQQNLRHHNLQKEAAFKEATSKLEFGDGKQSVSKRRQVKAQKKKVDLESSGEEEQSLLTRLSAQPSILQGEGKLRDYQIDGLNWMVSLYETGINGILADEMGLGKTVQTISFLAFLREFKRVHGYFLIIMPKSVVGNWLAEFRRWCPAIRVVNLIARKENREEIVKTQLQPGKFDVCITTFEGVRLCMPYLMRFTWEYIIIDEAHKIKNEDSQTSKRIRQFDSKYRLLLTGTPLQNNLHELWSLLNFLLPEIFASSDDFDEWFDLGKKQTDLSDAEIEERNNQIIKQLHKIIRPFMLRRIKRDVERSLLPKIEMHINVGITETQKSIYRQLLKKSTIEKGSSTSHYKNILVQLRKACNHPYLFEGIEPDDAPELGEHLVNVSGKMQFLDKLLQKAKADDSQTLIFSGFTSMLDILEDYCRFREYKYCRLDGNTELDHRQAQIDDFTSPETDKFIFLISTRAGGLGLNLMTANTVVLYDSDWNPQMDLQAMDRAHRIGQKKQVRVYRLITKNTMEEKMVEKQTMKLKLDSMIIQKGRMAPKNTGLGKEDLKDMVNYGADAIFEIGSNIDDMDIDQIIAEGEDRAKNLDKEAEELMKSKFDMLNFQMDSCNLYQFEDVDYLKEKRQEQEDLLKKNVIAMLDAETAETTRRKIKKSMAENKLCPNIYGNGNIGVSKEARKKRLAKVTDFRFYPDPERLRELLELEMEAKYSGYVQGVETPMFTEEMRKEKEEIEAKGFNNWDRKDFQKFIQAMELFATDDYANISKHMEHTKTPEEVQEYSEVFFKNVAQLNDSERIIQRIQKAQNNVSFNMRAPHIIRAKVSAYQNALDEMQLPFATHKSKFFSRESDIILLCLTDQLGFGNWPEIKRALRRENRCRFDNLLISRSEEEIKKRVVYLVQMLEKEKEEQRGDIAQKESGVYPGFESLNFNEMEKEIDALVSEHEAKALKAFMHIRTEKANKVLKNLEKERQSENRQPSLHSATLTSKKANEDTTSKAPAPSFTSTSHIHSQEQQMSGEFDKLDMSEEPNGVNEIAPKASKKQDEESQHSEIRLGKRRDSDDEDMRTITQKSDGDDENDEALLQRELEGLTGYGDSAANTTAAALNGVDSGAAKEVKSPQKSAKQSTLADWGVKSGQKDVQSVGVKREREDKEAQKKVSEFKVDNGKLKRRK